MNAELDRRDHTENVGADHWTETVRQATMSWLLGAFASNNTRTAYANRLGVPREHQAWRGPGQTQARKPPQSAFLPWCVAHGIDPLTGMTLDVLRAWIHDVRHEDGGRTDATVQAFVGAVSGWYREMRKRGLTTFTMGDVLDRDERRTLNITNRPASPTHPLTFEQAQALIVSTRLDTSRTRLRNVAIVELLLGTGIRAEELCKLDRGSITPGSSGTGHLTVDGKGGKTRVLSVQAPVMSAINRYLVDRDVDAAGNDLTIAGQVGARTAAREPLFLTSRSRRRLTPSRVTETLGRLCTLADRRSGPAARRAAAELMPICGSIHPHQLRRFYAVHAHNMGVPVRQIQADLGHTSLATTQRYLESAATVRGSGSAAVVSSLHTALDEWGITDNDDPAAVHEGQRQRLNIETSEMEATLTTATNLTDAQITELRQRAEREAGPSV